jgi:hypothetical protein
LTAVASREPPTESAVAVPSTHPRKSQPWLGGTFPGHDVVACAVVRAFHVESAQMFHVADSEGQPSVDFKAMAVAPRLTEDMTHKLGLVPLVTKPPENATSAL